MSVYAYIENGQVKRTGRLPRTWRMKDGRTVSGFHLMSSETHKSEGWLPLVENKPAYNPETEMLKFDNYEILGNKVIRHYTVEPLPEEPQPEPSPLEIEIADLWYEMMMEQARNNQQDQEIADLWYEIMMGGVAQ